MQQVEKAIILKVIRYSESDLIVHVLTSRGTRYNLFARSALKSRKRFGGGVLEPTHFVQVNFENRMSSTMDQLLPLKEAQLIDDFSGVRTTYERLQLALEFVRLVERVTRDGASDAHDLFNILGHGLKAAETATDLEALRTHFELKLLAGQGVLAQTPLEAKVLRVSLREHERLKLPATEMFTLRSRIKEVLREYLG